MQLSEPKPELDVGPVQVVEPEEFDILRKTLRVLAAVKVFPIDRRSVRQLPGHSSCHARAAS